ncbi:MAG: NAD-dependent succinate-semialdehyde dehydrogenase [Anaerolineae bacterium]|nr:NAD-dependent succinate-semialdehyde dehydrogenase [Anaerolineae bacterium]
MYLNGEWVNAASGRTRAIINPATEEVVAEVPYGGRHEAAQGLEIADKALPSWMARTAYERADILKRTADLIRARLDEIATALTQEVGKTLAESRGEIRASAAYFEWFAEEGKRAYGRIVPANLATRRRWVIKHPVGVVATIAPWNFPVLLQVRKIAAALAAGCTIVARPASATPLATMLMFSCLHDAGLPAGVANLVTGPSDEQTQVFMESPLCRKISFTGSTEVGKGLMRAAAEQLKKLSLELGGHAPFVVFDDVDPAYAARLAVAGKFRNMGQVCISPTRFYVQRRSLEAFMEEAVARARSWRVGNGLDANADVGPLFDRRQVESMEAFVADAVRKGAKVLCGGKRPGGEKYRRGFWFEPTVLADVNPTTRLTCDEVFGPILPIFSFDTLDEALCLANNTNYGLAAYVVTHDLRTTLRMAEGLQAGIIAVNDVTPATAEAPFGGRKESGFGREGGHEGIEEYLETKYVSLGLE